MSTALSESKNFYQIYKNTKYSVVLVCRTAKPEALHRLIAASQRCLPHYKNNERSTHIMLNTTTTILKASAAAALVVGLSACASSKSILPNSNNATKSPWATYADAKVAFDRIDTKTTKEALVVLGFDPAAMPNTRNLNYVDVVNLFGASFRIEDLPTGIKKCVRAREACNGYVIRSQNIKNKRNGNVAADLFGFSKQTQTTGWEFSATLVMVNNTVVYKLWNGTPVVDSTNRERNPLGPMQSLGDAIPAPF